MQYRYELKFPIRKDQIHLVNNWIDSNKFIKNHHPEREINSCYYDTPFYKNANDNIAGISRRLKHRSRWYDDLENIYFEIKIKKATLGSKLKCKLENYNILTKKLSINNFINNKEYYYKFLANTKLFPIVHIKYLRNYYIHNNIRITLDHNIKYKNLKSNNNFIKDNLILLEIKFDKIYLNDAKNFFKTFPFRARRNSKYLRSLSLLKIASYI